MYFNSIVKDVEVGSDINSEVKISMERSKEHF
jgi:hypothetical protein